MSRCPGRIDLYQPVTEIHMWIINVWTIQRESMPQPHHSYKSHNAVQQPLCKWGLWHHQCYALWECFLSNLIMEYRQRLRLGFKLWTLVTDNNGDITRLMAEYNWFYGPDSDLCAFQLGSSNKELVKQLEKGKTTCQTTSLWSLIFFWNIIYQFSVSYKTLNYFVCLSVTDMSTKFARCHWGSLKVPINK